MIISMFKFDKKSKRWIFAIFILALLTIGSLGYIDSVKKILDSEMFTFGIGDFNLSLYKILKSLLVLIVLFWFAGGVSALVEQRIKKLRKIKSSNRSLMIKAF